MQYAPTIQGLMGGGDELYLIWCHHGKEVEAYSQLSVKGSLKVSPAAVVQSTDCR